MNNEVVVSIYCAAYNHERYIRKTLDGFVNQITNFKYEVIVHDDASTDHTADIIREYADKYPQIIKPIYQVENQYSKGVYIFAAYVHPQMTSTKYYAICEGDDYWCDANKLQMQYDYMESHPECSMCVHNTKKVNETGDDLNQVFNPLNEDTNYGVDHIIRAGGGGLFHTSSFFWRKEYGVTLPDAFKIQGIGDYNRAIYFATKGYIHYIGQVLSVYRVGSINSWVKRTNNSRQAQIKHQVNVINGLEHMNEATNHQYDESFRVAIERGRFALLKMEKKYKEIVSDKSLRKLLWKEPIYNKFVFFVKFLIGK